MSFFLNFEGEENVDVVDFEPGSETAADETATEVSEVLTAADAVEDAADQIEDGAAIADTVESLICLGQLARGGEAVGKATLYAVESLFSSLVARNFPGDTLSAPDFESHVAGGESAMRARIAHYASEGFLEQAKAIGARLIAFIKAQFQKVVIFLLMLFTSAAKMKKSFEEIVSELGKEADYNASVEKDIKLSVSYLNDGKKANPAAALSAANTMYNFVQSQTKQLASTASKAFKEIASSSSAIDGAIQAVEKSRSQSYTSSASKLMVSGFKPVVTHGRLTFVAGPSIDKASIAALSKSELIAVAKAGAELCSSIEKHKENVKEINKMRDEEVKAIDEVAKAKGGAEATEAETARVAELRRKITSLTKVSATVEVASLAKASVLAFRVANAGLSFAKANKAALAKKK